MMSYGWAILIIVIVAAALWSFGVFSPSSSTSTTVIGFAGLGSVQAACSSTQGLLITLGDSVGSEINVTKINITSSSGYSSNLNTNILLTPSQSDTIFLSSTTACPSSGSRYSLTASITYTEPEQAFPGPYFSSGTVSGSSSSAVTFSSNNMIVLGIPHKVQLNITNSQSSPTPSPFQQMLNLSSGNFTAYGASNLQNVVFYYPDGQVIPSWLESNGTKNAAHTVYWLKLNSIGASPAKVTIYMGFAPAISNLFNPNNIGEAPQLSSTYGKYDDGANIFIQYGGASWSSFSFIQGTWVTSNGYLQQTSTAVSSDPRALIESKNYSATAYYILGMAFSYTTNAVARVGIIAMMSSAPNYGYRFIGQQNSNGAGFISFLNDNVGWPANNGYQGAVSTNYTMVITDSGGTWSGSLYNGYTENGVALTSLSPVAYTTNDYAGQNAGYVGISASYWTGASSIANPINVQWFYMRAYPPNGVMPSVSFGSVQ